MVLEVRVVAVFGGEATGTMHVGAGFGGANNVLFLLLGVFYMDAGYMGAFVVLKCIKLYSYSCTFLYDIFF